MEVDTLFTGRELTPPNRPTDSKQPKSKPKQAFGVEINKLILRSIWKCEGRRTGKTTLNKVEGFTLPDFNNYCKATIMKALCSWHKTDNQN